jgi:glucose/arabinose dehydrogenase
LADDSWGPTINFYGNWTNAGGTFNMGATAPTERWSGTNRAIYAFNGNMPNMLFSGTYVVDKNLVVGSGKTLSVTNGGALLCGTNVVSGAIFALQPGGTLGIGSAGGIVSSGSTGNIQTSTRTFNAGGSYIYNGTAAQITGTALPASANGIANLVVSNSAGVTLTAAVSVTNSLTVSSGSLALGANTVTLGTGASVFDSGVIQGSLTLQSGGKFFAGTDGGYGTATVSTNLTMTVGSTLNLDLNTTAGGANDLLIVSNTLTLNNTALVLKAPSAGASLDPSTDYILVTAGNITGTPTLSWAAGFMPVNTNNYQLVKTATSIKLHFINTAVVGSLSFQQSPLSTNAGAIISPAVTVLLLDTNNAPLTNVTVTLSLSNSAATLNGIGSQTSDAAGVVTFTNLSINTAGTYALQATAGFVPIVTNYSSAFVISNTAAARLAIVTQPSASATAGISFGTQPVIVVQDVFGNGVSNSTAVITASVGIGNLQGTTTINANGVDGRAVFGDLALTNAGSQTLILFSAGLPATNSVSINVAAGPATSLAWTVQPGTAVYGSTFGQQPSLRTRDQFGNYSAAGLPSTLTVSVSLTSGSGPLAGTISYNIGTSGNNGVVNFNNLQIKSAGNGKQLTASVGGSLSDTVSDLFTVAAAPLTVTADDKVRIVGTNNPPFTASYGGFVNGDSTGTALSGNPALSCAATPASPPGAYTISCGPGTLAASNYIFTFFNGTLTVLSSNAFIQRVANATLQLPPTPPLYGYGLTVLTNNSGGTINFNNICGFASAPGETNRLFVIERGGRIAVITNLIAPDRNVFLDISGKVDTASEGGLLGLAFHPGYATNGYFYVFYRGGDDTSSVGGGSGGHDILARYQASPPGANSASALTELKLIRQYDRADNHNAGDVHFGPDGCLYVSLGDEGWGPNSDPNYDKDYFQNAQYIDKNFFSTILRIDVDKRPGNLTPNVPHPAVPTNAAGAFYSVPADNPFIGMTNFDNRAVDPTKVRTEMYCIGLRNPWRFSFDSASGQLYCGDVGWVNREEVDIIKPGANYGWAFREGTVDGPRKSLEPGTGFTNTPPLFEYVHPSQGGGTYGTNTGNTVMGGVVYHGSRLSQLSGYYVFGDFSYSGSQAIWACKYDGTNISGFQRLTTESQIVAFGIDPSNGDVLLADNGDNLIRRLVYNTNSITGTPLPPTLADTGAFTNLLSLADSVTPLAPAPGIVRYDINVPFWSDNADKTRWFSIPNTNLNIGFSPTNNWSFPTGAVWIKHFDLEITNGVPASKRRLETRFIVKNVAGVYGVTYRWGNSLTNAALVPEEGLDEQFVIYSGSSVLRTQTWHYPSRAECLTCHTTVGGGPLGFNTPQMNRGKDYGIGIANQLTALSEAGYFSNSVPDPATLLALAHATNTAASLEFRVRSYLSANCVQCHQPGGAGPQQANWDARITMPLSSQGILNGLLVNNFGDSNNRVIKPGSLTNSILFYRVAILGADHMPPLATSIVNTQAVALLSQWITNGLVNPPSNNIISTLMSNGIFQTVLAGTPGITYIIQGATNVNGPWINLATNQADSNGLSSFGDVHSVDYSARFYRAVLAP